MAEYRRRSSETPGQEALVQALTAPAQLIPTSVQSREKPAKGLLEILFKKMFLPTSSRSKTGIWPSFFNSYR